MSTIAQTVEIALQHHRAGHLNQAEELYNQILHKDPFDPVALHSLALIAYQSGKYDIAVMHISKAIDKNPKIPELFNTLGLALEAQGKPEKAIEVYLQATLLKPDFHEAHHNTAIAMQSLGDYFAAAKKAEHAVTIKPDYAIAYNTLGYALQMQEKYNEAIKNYSKAIQLKPDFAEAYNHLGVILSSQGQYDQAAENYKQAILIDPDYAEAHWNQALILLLNGQLKEGFSQYQWRKKVEFDTPNYPHCFDKPIWQGSSFKDKTLLIHYEQGIGDTIQFIRYLPLVKARGGKVILEARKPLLGLLRGLPGIDELIEASFDKKPDVNFDLHISLMDLPAIFETTLETIPADIPYLHADPKKVEHWKNRINTDDFKIGIVWAGAAVHEKDSIRSCKLQEFEILTQIPGVSLYSLQKGRAAEQISQFSDKIQIKDLAEHLEDFSDTAAVIENLDLVISVDTAVAHLAAAMAKPVWLLLPSAPDWRWMLNRRDSPWYPTVRLFRQTKPQCWADVLRSVAAELKILAGKKKPQVFSTPEKKDDSSQTNTSDLAAMYSQALSAYQSGRYHLAEKLSTEAIDKNPKIPELFNILGLACEAQGELEKAIEAYLQATLLKPDFPEAHHNTAIAMQSLGDYYAAAKKAEHTVKLKPDYALAYNTLGYALQMQEKYNEAIKNYRKAIQLKPDFAEAYNHLGVTLNELSRYLEAVDEFTRAIRLEPNYAEAYNNRGIALKPLDRPDEAFEDYSKAIELEPDFPEAHYNLANLYSKRQQYTLAVENYEKAVRLKPDYPEAYFGLAHIFYQRRQYQPAIENYRIAIELKPDYAEAHYELSLTLLSIGQFETGFREYEWRKKARFNTPTCSYLFDVPSWNGSSFKDKKLLVHFEQGLGDTIQFIRYLPLVKARGGTVILEVRKPLMNLFRGFPGVDELIETSTAGAKSALDFDFHTFLMDLPATFGTTLETIPADTPYLHADPKKAEHWKNKINTTGLKVGLVWAGAPGHANDHNRSFQLEKFIELAQIPGVTLYSLQKGQAENQISQLSDKIQIINLADQFEDFSDTAAAIENLDLVISVDTAVAHLAGAMGKPVWNLIHYESDWRWMTDRDDSPWYPTMRLFRQEEPHQWNPVFERITAELTAMAAQNSPKISDPVDNQKALKEKLPVVIPAYKNPHQLENCIKHLKNQTIPIETFVRDNNQDNIYFTAAINEGIRKYLEYHCDYILILNQDMYLLPDAAEKMVKFMDSHPKCGIGAPLHLHPQNHDFVIFGGGCEAFPFGKHKGGKLSDFKDDQEIPWASGACLILRKRMIKEIGLFDENFVLLASDSDYCFTARSRGWQVCRIAAAKGIHEHGASAEVLDDEFEKLKFSDVIYFGEKWLTGRLYKDLACDGEDCTPEMIDAEMARIKAAREELENPKIC